MQSSTLPQEKRKAPDACFSQTRRRSTALGLANDEFTSSGGALWCSAFAQDTIEQENAQTQRQPDHHHIPFQIGRPFWLTMLVQIGGSQEGIHQRASHQTTNRQQGSLRRYLPALLPASQHYP